MTHELTKQYVDDPMGWHYDVIPPLIRALRPDVYVELGVRTADLFNMVSPFVGTAIGVDIDPVSKGAVRYDDNVEFHLCSTDEFLAEVQRRGLLIDVLFIDADHSEEAAYADFRNYFPYIRPHGLILMHDAHPGDDSLCAPEWCGGVCRAIERLGRDNREYEMVTIPFSPGLVICRKRSMQLSWEECASHDDVAHFRGAELQTAHLPTGDERGENKPAIPLSNRLKATFRPIVSAVLGEARLRRLLALVRQ